MDETERAEHARLREINGSMCPNGIHLVVNNYNVFGQHMWESDRQEWHCETCLAHVVRTFLHPPAGYGWSRWELVR